VSFHASEGLIVPVLVKVLEGNVQHSSTSSAREVQSFPIRSLLSYFFQGYVLWTNR